MGRRPAQGIGPRRALGIGPRRELARAGHWEEGPRRALGIGRGRGGFGRFLTGVVDIGEPAPTGITVKSG